MARVRRWLRPYSWEFVTAQNAVLCHAKNALHKPTSDGHQKAKTLWEASYQAELTLDDAVEICRKCHRIAPFCFYNGNTFSAIIRDVINEMGIEAERSYVVRSLAGHIVAGVATREEEEAFREFCESFE